MCIHLCLSVPTYSCTWSSNVLAVSCVVSFSLEEIASFRADNESAFDLLYCIAFKLLDHQWLEMRASYMDFNVSSPWPKCFEWCVEWSFACVFLSQSSIKNVICDCIVWPYQKLSAYHALSFFFLDRRWWKLRAVSLRESYCSRM